MKLLLLGYFDAGFSADVDDRCFTGNARLNVIARLPQELRNGVQFGHEWPDGNEVVVGRGISVDLTLTTGAEWLKATQVHAAATGDDEDRALLPAIDNLVVERCELRVFSLGIALVSLQVSVPHGHESEVIRLGRLLEWASYGQASENAAYTGLVIQLQRYARHIIDSVHSTETLAGLTQRPPTYGMAENGHLPIRAASGYVQVILEEEGDDHSAIINAAKDYEGQRGLAELDMDDAMVWLGWAVTVVGRPGQTHAGRIIALLEICQLFYGITESFETLLTRRFLRATQHSFQSHHSLRESTAESLDVHGLYRLRMLALTLIGITSFKATTNNISDWLLLDAFEDRAQIRERHARIAHAAEIFADAEAQMVREREEVRSQKVKLALALIAALGLVSVATAVIDVVQIPDGTMTYAAGRLLVVLLSVGVAISLCVWIMTSKGRL